jgi:hypothetical protein
MTPNSSNRTAQLALGMVLGAATLFAAVPSWAQLENRFPTPLPPKIVAGEVIVHFRPGITDRRAISLAAVSVFLRSLELQDDVVARVPPGTEFQLPIFEVDPNVVSAEPTAICERAAP